MKRGHRWVKDMAKTSWRVKALCWKVLWELDPWRRTKPAVPGPPQSVWPASPVGQLCTQGDGVDGAHPHRAPFSLERVEMEQRKASPSLTALPSILSGDPWGILSREKYKLGGLPSDTVSGLVCGHRTDTMRKSSVRAGLSCSFCGPRPSSGLAHSRHLHLIHSLIAASIYWIITTQVLFSAISMY